MDLRSEFKFLAELNSTTLLFRRKRVKVIEMGCLRKLSFILVLIAAPSLRAADYVAELQLNVVNVFSGDVIIGLRESKLIKKDKHTRVLLVSESSVANNIADLHYTIIEQSNSEPLNLNQLQLPSMTTYVGSEAGVEVEGVVSYRVVVRAH
ncbi:hypothetical protein VSAK1_12820 [Vibrio mediterranei AK1]|uniref:hypothetical protein n=1 Tax=Vibrio mediterranei TaxID=689 RepID=UPI0001541B44|nr:hypothetical protein [Vibrio mediterranei]EDL53245.1 hypothetical protein VSAK1_12820 [Vibrio mediterranei AK1]